MDFILCFQTGCTDGVFPQRYTDWSCFMILYVILYVRLFQHLISVPTDLKVHQSFYLKMHRQIWVGWNVLEILLLWPTLNLNSLVLFD